MVTKETITLEFIEKRRNIQRELWKNPEYRKHMVEIHKGKTTSLKQKESARQFFLRNNPMKNKDIRDKISKMMSLRQKGKKCSEETKEKMGMSHRGEKSWNWKGGVSYNKSPLRYGDDWNKIRLLIYKRDKFTCQECGKKGISMDIHHIIPFIISLDNSLNNLITLCRSCHMKIEMRLNKEIQNG